jgi:arabinofuranosyltransferase
MKSFARRFAPLAAALVAAAHAASFLGHGPCDDDFITYRYARNFVEGHGLVFNLGERVEGFSAPGWMFLVAAGLRLGIDPEVFSVALSIFSCGVAAWAVGELWKRRHPDSWSAGPAWLLAAIPALGWHAIIGLGTTVFAALLALWAMLWDRAVARERPALAAAIALGLAAFVRNEAVLFALPFLLHEQRRGKLAPASLALAPLVAWQAFRVVYFGRWVPVTYSVKKLALDDDLRLGLEYLVRSNSECGVGVMLVLAAVAASSERGASFLRLAALGFLAHVAYVVYVGGDFLPFARFFVPALPIGAWLAFEGAAALAGAHRGWSVLGFAAAAGLLQLQHTRRAEFAADHADSEPRWKLMAQAVVRAVPSTTKVALAPIGAFGWVSRLYIVDMLGLTNTAILEAPPDPGISIKGHQRYDSDWVLAQDPELVIIGNGWLSIGADGQTELKASHWERTLVEDPRFVERYEPLRLEVPGSYPLLFFWRRDAPLPSGATRL